MTKTTRVAFSCRGVKAVRSFGPGCPVEKALSSCANSDTERAVMVSRCEW